MQITVNSTILATELRLINHVVAMKPTLPIHANVLLRAEENLYLYATDHEIGFSTGCHAQVDVPGMMTLPAKRLLDLVEQLPDADVYLSYDGKQAQIRMGAFHGRLQCLPPQDFPAVPTPVEQSSSLPVMAFLAMIKRVRFAISDKSSYAQMGALLNIHEGVAGLVATDGKRLSVASMSQVGGMPTSVIIPTKALDALAGLFSSGDLMFSQSDKHLFFVCGHRMFFSRMIAGQFPNYLRIIPQENELHATVNRSQLMAALRRISLVSPENQTVYLDFEPEGLSISSGCADIGEAEEQVGAVYNGSPMKLCLSGRFLLDFLETTDETTVVLDFKDKKTPLVVKDGEQFMNVIMLMRA